MKELAFGRKRKLYFRQQEGKEDVGVPVGDLITRKVSEVFAEKWK